MAHMYILECADGSYYTGSTIDLERRLWQHQNGCGANHTAKRLPVKLVYCEFFDRVSDAFKREKQVQGWTRRKKEALMADDSDLLHHLAKCQNESHFRRLDSVSNNILHIDNQCSYLTTPSSYLSEAEDSEAEDSEAEDSEAEDSEAETI